MANQRLVVLLSDPPPLVSAHLCLTLRLVQLSTTGCYRKPAPEIFSPPLQLRRRAVVCPMCYFSLVIGIASYFITSPCFSASALLAVAAAQLNKPQKYPHEHELTHCKERARARSSEKLHYNATLHETTPAHHINNGWEPTDGCWVGADRGGALSSASHN